MKTIPGKNLYVARIEEDTTKYYLIAECFEDAVKLFEEFAEGELTLKDMRVVEKMTTVIFG